MRSRESEFFNALENVFVGVPIEGESGYINLMKIKSRYCRNVMRPRLEEKIDKALKSFPEFREELFDKLYTFFRRYFAENGSLGFFFTPYHESVYERVYTNEEDVVLFWRTSRLYYVKTDRLFRKMDVEVDGFRFSFDVSMLEHKKANEKRNLVFEFSNIREDGALVFRVLYSEGNKKTKMDEIRWGIRDALGLRSYTEKVPSEETLEKAFRVFERQSEVDFFICKDARSFLREQFDLWMWQYLLGKPGEEPQTEWTERRIRELQVLKRIAYKVIDFIAAFEDELVKIWNKPKFVLHSNYVITLDRIFEKDEGLLEEIASHLGFTEQVKEWQNLGMVDENFSQDALWEVDLTGKRLHPRYQFLPLDTRYFKDLELGILGLFENLDESLDGWLIKSENYQALNTILPKFRGRVQCIYIDPPYNTGSDEFIYEDRIRHSSWLTMMEERARLARTFLTQNGVFFVSIDFHEYPHLLKLLEQVYGLNALVGTFHIKVRHEGRILTGDKEVQEVMEQVLCFKNPFFEIGKIPVSEKPEEYRLKIIEKTKPSQVVTLGGRRVEIFEAGQYEIMEAESSEGLFKPISIRGTIRKGNSSGRFFVSNIEGRYQPGTLLKVEGIGDDGLGYRYFLIPEKAKNGIYFQGTPLTRTTKEKPYPTFYDMVQEFNEVGYEGAIDFKYGKKPIALLLQLLKIGNVWSDAIILDFFAGSGTTAHAVINLNREDGGKRKYILVEVADYFHTVLLPRIKKVVFSDKWKDGKAQPEGKGISHFVKYYELEQYEDILRRTKYLEDDLFTPPPDEDPCQYIFLRDPKMLEVLDVDLEAGKVEIHLERLYEDIDLPETLSNLTGKWIKRIVPDPENPTKPGKVEFADGDVVDLKNLDWRIIKPLIWW